MREFEKLKKERELERQKKEQARLEELKKKEEAEIAAGNPLIMSESGVSGDVEPYSLKKKWYEESVFRNQARDHPKSQKRFINDTVRSDFHKKFMSKYV